MSFTGTSAMSRWGGRTLLKGCGDRWNLIGLSLPLQERVVTLFMYVIVMGTWLVF